MYCVGRYRAELLERRGERLNSEGDLRGAIQDYQRVSSDFIIVPLHCYRCYGIIDVWAAGQFLDPSQRVT
jgi:hypothetical protein